MAFVGAVPRPGLAITGTELKPIPASGPGPARPSTHPRSSYQHQFLGVLSNSGAPSSAFAGLISAEVQQGPAEEEVGRAGLQPGRSGAQRMGT